VPGWRRGRRLLYGIVNHNLKISSGLVKKGSWIPAPVYGLSIAGSSPVASNPTASHGSSAKRHQR